MSANGKISRWAAQPSFAHLRRLTDDTGLLEHALGRIPRRREGYTTDDNARALWTVTEWLSLEEKELRNEDRTEIRRLADIYLAFLLWAQNDDGWWLNNFAYDRTLEPEDISHDCQGRSIWACADAWIRLGDPIRETARIIVERAVPTLGRIDSLRGQAFAMAACAHLLEAARDGMIELPQDIKGDLQHHMIRLELLLNRAYRDFSENKWRWFEPAMTYSNGVLPWAMLRTFRYTQRQETFTNGMESLSFLLQVMTTDEGWLRPIGNEDWCSSESDTVSRWDQQPLELFKLALALEEAALAAEQSQRLVGSALGHGTTLDFRAGGIRLHSYGALDQPGLNPRAGMETDYRTHYRDIRDLCRDWYYGDNDLRVPVADPTDGSCCDGLTPYGANLNCGAEATISYLMTEALCRRK
ncbi:hypothetical protein [Cohnella mopanensis]|uniref:hypothetical protein n=1 Tax=Cohnella mopanensis TaxID=2911966 RepID=UPI001EF7A110|nr:hypothetical protein [Cohnella mopanensis]